MLRRLFQRFQQRIEAVAGEHVHFVDQVDLEAPARRRVLHILKQLAGVLDLCATRRIHLDQVDKPALIDLQTGRALTAGFRADAPFAVKTFGQNPGDGGLADPAGTGKQIGVVQPVVIKRIDHGLQHMGLADHLAEQAGPPLAG